MSRILNIVLAIFLSTFAVSSFSAGNVSNVITEESADQVAQELSQITALFVYNLDDIHLEQTLSVIAKNNTHIKAVVINDHGTESVFASYYMNEDGQWTSGDVPDSLRSYRSATANIYFDGMVIGDISVRVETSSQLGEIDPFTKNMLALAGMFIAFVSILGLMFKMVTKAESNVGYLSFGTRKFASAVLFALALFVTLSFAAGYIMIDYNKRNIQQRTEETFNQYLVSLDNTLHTVNEIRTATFRHVFSKRDFQNYFFSIVEAMEAGDSSTANDYRDKLTGFWLRYREFGNGRSKLILSPDFQVIYSNGRPINKNLINRSYDSSFHLALRGESSLFPVRSLLSDDGGAASYRLMFATPVTNSDTGKVDAVAIVEVDGFESTYKNLSNYYFSETGEMMAVDINGALLSSTRFIGDKSHGNFDFIKEMLNDAKKYGMTNKLNGLYLSTDYRGNEVYSMLRWSKGLNVALVAKIDSRELLEDYNNFRSGLFTIIIAMVAFTVPSMLFTLYAGKKSNENIKESRREIITRLGHAAEFKDNETAMHIVRMSRYTEILARNHGMSKEWVDLLGNAAPMHDIGKIGIPDAILQKPGKLTDEEYEIMKKHPKFGADIIGDHPDSNLLSLAKEIAMYHHEKWDGTGYPVGLSGYHIPLSARLVAIADVFDALTSERTYKKAWPLEEAVHLIIREAGTHFDPELVNVFKQSLPEFKVVMSRYKDDQDIQHFKV